MNMTDDKPKQKAFCQREYFDGFQTWPAGSVIAVDAHLDLTTSRSLAPMPKSQEELFAMHQQATTIPDLPEMDFNRMAQEAKRKHAMMTDPRLVAAHAQVGDQPEAIAPREVPSPELLPKQHQEPADPGRGQQKRGKGKSG